jgi:SPP1 gp7 family putative phage head morphogenesis protein
MAEATFDQIENQNRRYYERTTKGIASIPPLSSEAWLASEREAFVATQRKLITKISAEQFDRVEQAVLSGLRDGKLAPDIAKQLEKQVGIPKRKAQLIARDQTSKLVGNLNQYRQKSLGISQYVWSTAGDNRVRPEHEALEGQVFSWDDPPDTGHPGEAINCVPAGCNVSLHSIANKAFRRRYAGELTEIVAGSGEPLRLTPNHPVLTHRGWVAAHLVKVGDYLVEATFEKSQALVSYPQCRNTEVQKVFSSLQTLGAVHRVHGLTSGFHGDSAAKDVDIVDINRILFLNKMAHRLEPIGDNNFALSDNSSPRKRNFSFSSIGHNSPPGSVMCSLSERSDLFWGGVSHSLIHGGTSVADGNLAIDQYPSDWCTGAPEDMSDLFLTRAVQIHPDNFIFRKVKSVVRRSFDGFVHNFETITGWYSSSNLIVHNCRCVAIPVISTK